MSLAMSVLSTKSITGPPGRKLYDKMPRTTMSLFIRCTPMLNGSNAPCVGSSMSRPSNFFGLYAAVFFGMSIPNLRKASLNWSRSSKFAMPLMRSSPTGPSVCASEARYMLFSVRFLNVPSIIS